LSLVGSLGSALVLSQAAPVVAISVKVTSTNGHGFVQLPYKTSQGQAGSVYSQPIDFTVVTPQP
jgi:hypothetical protein